MNTSFTYRVNAFGEGLKFRGNREKSTFTIVVNTHLPNYLRFEFTYEVPKQDFNQMERDWTYNDWVNFLEQY